MGSRDRKDWQGAENSERGSLGDDWESGGQSLGGRRNVVGPG